jgi:hypothetical protein
MSNPLHSCPKCKGKGKSTITAHEGGKKTTFQMECFWCAGFGTLTDIGLEKVKAMDAAWCRCGNPSGETRPYNHGGCHGWECCDCGKVTQTG